MEGAHLGASNHTVVRRAWIWPEEAAKTSLGEVLRHLPKNYQAARDENDASIRIVGIDRYRWTLEGFIIPLLEEHSIRATVLPSMVLPEIVVQTDLPGGFGGFTMGVDGVTIHVPSIARQLPGPPDSGDRFLPHDPDDAEESDSPDDWDPLDEEEPEVRQWDDPISTVCEDCGQQYRYTMEQLMYGDGDPHLPGCKGYRETPPTHGAESASCEPRPSQGRAVGCCRYRSARHRQR